MMRIGSMFNDVFLSLFKRPFTERYPFVVRPVPERTRGRLAYEMSKCTGCMLCVRDCPADAISVTVVDRAAKKFVFRYRTDRCIYCAQCVASCKPQALSMSRDDWHLAATDKGPFTVVYGEEPVLSSSGQEPRG
jgi:formate hydrogenlyase subunit 6/NADH:ubiquinone oxidoreductase subunit I